MNLPRISLLGSQHRKLMDHFSSDPSGHERAAIVLFRKFSVPETELARSERYVAVDVIPFENNWVTESSATHVAFQLKPLVDIFRRCEEEDLVFGFVHNHPTSATSFSSVDDVNESVLLNALKNRNGSKSELIALLWAGEKWHGRLRGDSREDKARQIQHIAVYDDGITVTGHRGEHSHADEILDRQAAAFGRPFVDVLQSLRVAIVGAGGTGSAVATLLARAGVGELIIIDDDHLESSNLNRVRGSTIRDIGRSKSQVLKEYINGLGLNVSAYSMNSKVDMDPSAIDVLSTCDVVFGCTDDQIGRELMNLALYVYGFAYIDLGLGGRVDEDKFGDAILRNHHARISTILPESGECLFCQGVLREDWLRRQQALRDNPDLSEEELDERYLSGGAESAPGVAPFVGAAADYAVANLFELIRSFRRLPGNVREDMYSLDFVNMEVSSREKKSDLSCEFCQRESFTLMKEGYRLNRPALGKRNELA